MHALPVPDWLSARLDRKRVDVLRDESLERRRKELLAHFAHRHPDEQVGGCNVADRLRVVAGDPARAVLDEARTSHADLVVVGSSGKRKQLDLGGVGRAILHHAPCPIWQQVDAYRPVRRILVPVDLSQHSLDALERVLGLARKLKATVTAAHCFDVREYSHIGMPDGALADTAYTIRSLVDDARSHFERLMGELDWQGVEHETVYAQESPEAHLLEHEDEYDLIALGTHHRTGLLAALVSGVAWTLMRNAKTAVLAIPTR